MHPKWPVELVLALATWAIYICDRLLDARAGLCEAALVNLRERHYFHWRHRRVFFALASGAMALAAGTCLSLLPATLDQRGVVLAAVSVAYFSGVHVRLDKRDRTVRFLTRNLSKELLVAVLFAAGCMLPEWPRTHSLATPKIGLWQFWIPGIYFAAVVWLNCWCIERWESAPTAFAKRKPGIKGPQILTSGACRTAILVALCGGLLALLAPASEAQSAALLTAGTATALMLSLLDRLRPRMTPLSLRASADLVMLTPMFVIFR